MTNEQMQDYIELQRQYIQITLKRGHTMEELDALRKIEKFESSLECNKETEIYINCRFTPINQST